MDIVTFPLVLFSYFFLYLFFSAHDPLEYLYELFIIFRSRVVVEEEITAARLLRLLTAFSCSVRRMWLKLQPKRQTSFTKATTTTTGEEQTTGLIRCSNGVAPSSRWLTWCRNWRVLPHHLGKPILKRILIMNVRMRDIQLKLNGKNLPFCRFGGTKGKGFLNATKGEKSIHYFVEPKELLLF